MAEERIDIKINVDDSGAKGTLKDLRSKLKELEDTAKTIGKGGAGFKELQKSIEDTKKSLLEESIAAAKSAKSMGELRKAMSQLKTAQEEVDQSSPDFDRLVDAINETEGRVGDLNDQFNTFAGSGMERAKRSTGLLNEGFQNLDFDKVSIGFKGITNLVGGFTTAINKSNPFINGFGGSMGNLKEQFSAFGQTGIGGVVKALGALSKAILTNPIMLLATVIIGLIAVVVQFYDKIKPVKAMVEAIGKAFDYVVGALKRFSDSLGLTTFAAEDALSKQKKFAETYAEYQEAKYDREISLARAAGKETSTLELQKIKMAELALKQKQQFIIKENLLRGSATEESNKAIQENAAALYKLETEYQTILAGIGKKAADEVVKTSEEAKKVSDDAEKKRKETAAKIKAERDAADAARKADNEKLLKETEDLNAKLIKDAETREKELLKLSTERALSEIETSKADEGVKSAARIAIIEDEKKQLLDIEKKFQQERDQIQQADDEAQKQRTHELNQLKLEGKDLELANLAEELDEKMAMYEGDEEMQWALVQQYQEQKDQIKADYDAKERDRKQQELDNVISIGQQSNDAMLGLANALFDAKRSHLEKGSAEELKFAKKQFQINKAMQLSSAVITGVQSVMAAFKNGMNNPVPLLGPATAAIYAAVAGVTAAANVAKIAATKFESGSFSPASGGSAPSAPGGSSQAAGSFKPSSFYTLGTPTGTGAGQGGQNTVYVGDINKVQNKVVVLENRSTLGQ